MPVSELMTVIEDCVSKFDPQRLKSEGSRSNWQGEGMPYCELAFKSNSSKDRMLFYGAIFTSLLQGLALPTIFFLLSGMVDGFGRSATTTTQLDSNDAAIELANSMDLTTEELSARFAAENGESDPLSSTRRIALIQVYIAVIMFFLASASTFFFEVFAANLAR